MALPFVFLTFVDYDKLLWEKELFSQSGSNGPISLKTYFVTS
jgi:hypothetical protein